MAERRRGVGGSKLRLLAVLGLGFVRVERRPRIWGTEGRRRLLFIGRMRSASTCGSLPGDTACGHKTRARTRVRLEEGAKPVWCGCGADSGGSRRAGLAWTGVHGQRRSSAQGHGQRRRRAREVEGGPDRWGPPGGERGRRRRTGPGEWKLGRREGSLGRRKEKEKEGEGEGLGQPG